MHEAERKKNFEQEGLKCICLTHNTSCAGVALCCRFCATNKSDAASFIVTTPESLSLLSLICTAGPHHNSRGAPCSAVHPCLSSIPRADYSAAFRSLASRMERSILAKTEYFKDFHKKICCYSALFLFWKGTLTFCILHVL